MANLKNLNAEQRTAVKATEGPVLIFAGAGSGKTRVLTHKIAYLIHEAGYAPENILSVTFTNKAAGEMRERVGEILKSDVSHLSIGTFHSICARILRNEIHHLGFTRSFAIYDPQDKETLLKIILDQLNVSKDYISARTASHQISMFKNKMILPEDAKEGAKKVIDQRMADIYSGYQRALKDNDALDFDDLLVFPLVLFKKKPAILKKYQEKWKYVLVDEYQDTNKPQFLFVSQIADKHKQITVVGDDDQSIYGWRGADIQNILDFEKIFPNCTTIKLERNYRSTQNILNAAMAVVENNTERTPKTLKAENGMGEGVGFLETEDELEEADAVVNALEKEIKLHKRLLSEFAILYRTNAQSRALEDSFRRMGIPYNIVGGIRFYERKETKDILAYLRLIINPKDTIALRRVINFPPRGIGLKTVDKCVKQAADVKKELFDVLDDPNQMDIRGKQAMALKEFHDTIVKFRDLIEKLNPNEFTRALVEETGIINHYKSSDELDRDERIGNINELLNSIEDFVNRNPDHDLTDFIEEVSLLSSVDEWNDENNRVTLMTVHSAKGLEFPIVFVVGLEDGLFPLYRSLDNPKNLEEERRLFYVALTRAKEKVFLMYAKNRRRMGIDYDVGMVSRFIREIPEELLESISFQSAMTKKVYKGRAGKTRVQVTRTVVAFDDFKVGDYVEHAIFGIGHIKALTGAGENQRVGVVFKDGLKKKLIVKYANLKKVETA
ncbi:MAG: UvrD-helicase domain-containing protein [Candidatus Marinimicrobia bacterium]|nr:UvrD-helicase domain-containing protein [Candidatus Neomarinimicrobiota bacterium]